MYSLCVGPGQPPCMITVSLNSYRLQASCLEEVMRDGVVIDWSCVGESHKPNRSSVYPDRRKKHFVESTCKKSWCVLDNTLPMEQHISHLCRSAYLAMRQTASIRRYLTEKKTTVQLVCSFVLSSLGYCNATLAGLPATHIARLQRIQNNAARLVLQKSKRHVTPLLKQLHWLPIQTGIDYKLATLAFRHCDGSLPQYLSSRLDIYQPSRSLRSASSHRTVVE